MIANAPRLGSVTSCVPSGVTLSPRKVRLLRRAPPRLRPVAAGAPRRPPPRPMLGAHQPCVGLSLPLRPSDKEFRN